MRPLDRADACPHSERMDTQSAEWREGFEAGSREVRDDGWTADTARSYLAMVEPDGSDFDAGHRAAIEAVS